jgi:hypothetical protein
VVLGTEVKPEAPADGGRLNHVKAVQGILYTTTMLRETKTYTVIPAAALATPRRGLAGRSRQQHSPGRPRFVTAGATPG